MIGNVGLINGARTILCLRPIFPFLFGALDYIFANGERIWAGGVKSWGREHGSSSSSCAKAKVLIRAKKGAFQEFSKQNKTFGMNFRVDGRRVLHRKPTEIDRRMTPSRSIPVRTCCMGFCPKQEQKKKEWSMDDARRPRKILIILIKV